MEVNKEENQEEIKEDEIDPLNSRTNEKQD